MAGAAGEARFAGLSLVQLNDLLEDEGQLAEMVQKMEETQNVQLSKEMTLASNRSLAEGNLLFQPRLDALKAGLTQKYQELRVLFDAYQLKKAKLDSQPSSASLETLLALLQAEGAKIEEDTENMAEKFLDGELPLDAFIDVYQSQRKLAHVRRVKIEKLQEMVLRRPRLPPAPAPLLLPRVPEPVPAAPLPCPTPEASGAPSVMPRRIPPPVPAGRLATPFTAAMGSAQASPYPGPLCPPLPPRVGLPPQQGFSTQFVSPFPPPLPQRPPPRLPHQPGFILQ
ncbi:vacuolar protein sorting-associated protein 37B [Sturnira hondurensis]|uniref:vacuolar protein sorting-associated protein 37B n=1 Tax=Sturnira hondurensis TaxID=192404 RepID=UPI0018798BE1|nr:vacuolar protein sorting-associated protein 37B [Sturnira hondurensis]XP_036907863.1 vacuolar protein sorting-associated protein 37B [Sturnira hondurensis]